MKRHGASNQRIRQQLSGASVLRLPLKNPVQRFVRLVEPGQRFLVLAVLQQVIPCAGARRPELQGQLIACFALRQLRGFAPFFTGVGVPLQMGEGVGFAIVGVAEELLGRGVIRRARAHSGKRSFGAVVPRQRSLRFVVLHQEVAHRAVVAAQRHRQIRPARMQQRQAFPDLDRFTELGLRISPITRSAIRRAEVGVEICQLQVVFSDRRVFAGQRLGNRQTFMEDPFCLGAETERIEKGPEIVVADNQTELVGGHLRAIAGEKLQQTVALLKGRLRVVPIPGLPVQMPECVIVFCQTMSDIGVLRRLLDEAIARRARLLHERHGLDSLSGAEVHRGQGCLQVRQVDLMGRFAGIFVNQLPPHGDAALE